MILNTCCSMFYDIFSICPLIWKTIIEFLVCPISRILVHYKNGISVFIVDKSETDSLRRNGTYILSFSMEKLVPGYFFLRENSTPGLYLSEGKVYSWGRSYAGGKSTLQNSSSETTVLNKTEP